MALVIYSKDLNIYSQNPLLISKLPNFKKTVVTSILQLTPCQTILEPILLYHALKCKQTQKQCRRTIYKTTLLPSCQTNVSVVLLYRSRSDHTWSCCRFIETQSSLRSKKIHRRNQDSSFLGGSFSNRDNLRAPIQLRREGQPQHLKR